MINGAIKKRFDGWWKNEAADRPMIRLIAEREAAPDPSGLYDLSEYDTPELWHTCPAFKTEWHLNHLQTHDYLYEGVRYIDLNYGPGSMAAYLGRKPQFAADTVWYEPIPAASLRELPLPRFDPAAAYFARHLREIKEAVSLSAGRFPVCIPDILENLDVLALLRGSEELCLDMMDDPEAVKAYLGAVADIYMDYYDAFYEAVRGGESGRECMYTAFSIWGRDKTIKIQCDFSCLLSAPQFDEFVFPYLKRQTEEVPYSLYHLDGKDAVRHLPSVLKLEKLNALQWTPGAGETDGGDEKWYPIYDKAMDAGKSLWISFCDGSVENMIERSKKIAERYGNRGLYFHYPVVKEKDVILFKRAYGDE